MTIEFADLSTVGQISVEFRLVCPLSEIQARVARGLMWHYRWTEVRHRARYGHAEPPGPAHETGPIHLIEERKRRGFLARDDEIETCRPRRRMVEFGQAAHTDRTQRSRDRLAQVTGGSGQADVGLRQRALRAGRIRHEVTKEPKLPPPTGLLFFVQGGFPDPGLEQSLPLKEFEKEYDSCWQDVGAAGRHDVINTVSSVEERFDAAKDLDQERVGQCV
jgi:hypothetical protein